MKVVATVAEIRRETAGARRPLGLVPTMGYLHEGHLCLVRRARAENLTVIASIFVNPTQFGPQEDLASYPRDMGRDLSLLENEGVDLVFAPSAQEMYPQGFDTWVSVDRLTRRLEGEHRPGHFKGVATVVFKLFNIVRPDRAYFGQKDAQQVLVVKRMACDLDIGVQIVVVPTVREPDGLAMSSRNTYLGPAERRAALVLFRSLTLAQKLYEQKVRDAEHIRREIRKTLESEPLAKIDYVSIADANTLEEMDTLDPPALVSLAVRIGKTRLIDNILVL